MTPVSLLTAITDTARVSGRSAAATAPGGYVPTFVWPEQGHIEAVGAEGFQRFENGLVLDHGADEVTPPGLGAVAGEAQERDVVALRRA